MPFLNPAPFIKYINFEVPQKRIEEFDFEWMVNENNDLIKVNIYIKKKLIKLIT